MRRLGPILLSVFLLGTTAGPSRAADPDPAIRDTITRQIDAFNAGDAVNAESFASPAIRTLFPDPDAFLGMVRSGYAPLIHPRSTTFDATVTSDKGAIQHVTIVDKDGSVWTAVYSLETIDGRWAISGCVLVRSKETTA